MKRLIISIIIFASSILSCYSQSVIDIVDERPSEDSVAKIDNITLQAFELKISDENNKKLNSCISQIVQKSDNDTFIMSFGQKDGYMFIHVQAWSLWGIVDDKNRIDNLFGVIEIKCNNIMKRFFLTKYESSKTDKKISDFIHKENKKLTFRRVPVVHEQEYYTLIDGNLTCFAAYIYPSFSILEFIINGKRI